LLEVVGDVRAQVQVPRAQRRQRGAEGGLVGEHLAGSRLPARRPGEVEALVAEREVAARLDAGELLEEHAVVGVEAQPEAGRRIGAQAGAQRSEEALLPLPALERLRVVEAVAARDLEREDLARAFRL